MVPPYCQVQIYDKIEKRCERISGALFKSFSLSAPMESALSLLIGPTIFKNLRPLTINIMFLKPLFIKSSRQNRC